MLNRSETRSLALLKRQSKTWLELIMRQLAKLEAALTNLARQYPNAHAPSTSCARSCASAGSLQLRSASSVPEIGTQTRKQIASLAGLARMTRQSAQWRGTAFIQRGHKFLRDGLYMHALVAARLNPNLRQKYQAMIQAGKPAKADLTALVRKMIELANAVVQQDRTSTPKTA